MLGDDENIRKILVRENELRLSPAVQLRFSEAEKSGSSDWIEVAGEVQSEVLAEFGIRPTPSALNELRVSAVRIGISLYVVHNRASAGYLEIGSKAPDVPLFDLSGVPKNLLDYQRPGRPLVVLAG